MEYSQDRPEQKLSLDTTVVSEIVEFARQYSDSFHLSQAALARLREIAQTIPDAENDSDFMAAWNEVLQIVQSAKAANTGISD